MNIKWEATLADGTIIGQGQTPYQDIFTRHLAVREFRLMNRDSNSPLIIVPVGPDDRVIYRRRRENKMALRTGQENNQMNVWQVILQKPDYNLVGRNGEVHYQQVCLDEVTGRAAKSRNFEGAFLDYPSLYDCEREAGVVPPRRRNDDGHARG